MKIHFNGREYASINAMPPDVRKTYEAALRLMTRQQTAEDVNHAMRTGMRVDAKISIGGTVYESIDDLPPHLRVRVNELAARSSRPKRDWFATILRKPAAASAPGQLSPPKVTLAFLALLIVTMVLYFAEYTALHNTFGSNTITAWALLPALAVAVLVLPRFFARLPLSRVLSWGLAALVLLCVWAASAAMLSLMNRTFSRAASVPVRFTVEKKLHYPAGPTTSGSYNLLVRNGDRKANLVVNQDLWQVTSPGGSVEAILRHGALGFDYIVPPIEPGR